MIRRILNTLLGKKYYVNMMQNNFNHQHLLCSKIFATRGEAEEHRRSLADNRTYSFARTITLRSRRELQTEIEPEGL